MFTMVRLKMMVLSTTAALLAASTPAMAEVETRPVEYQDLDLSTPAGQQRLMTRIKSAVKAVCGQPGAFSLIEKQDLMRCRRDAMDKAMPKFERTVARYMATKRLAANEPSAIVGN
jgi:UrcA family protein